MWVLNMSMSMTTLCIMGCKETLSKVKFWLTVVMCANYVLNRCPTKALKTIAPYEAWNGHKPNVGHMIIFANLAYALCHHNSAISFKSKQQNAFLLATAKKAKVNGCFRLLLVRASSFGMWYLLKMQLTHLWIAPKSQFLINQMHLILCYNCPKILCLKVIN